MATDSENLYSGKQLDLLGTDMTRRACKLAFAEANIKPTDIDTIELHDVGLFLILPIDHSS